MTNKPSVDAKPCPICKEFYKDGSWVQFNCNLCKNTGVIAVEDPKPCPRELDAAIKIADARNQEVADLDFGGVFWACGILRAEISRLKKQQPEIDEAKIPYGHSTRTAATIDEGE